MPLGDRDVRELARRSLHGLRPCAIGVVVVTSQGRVVDLVDIIDISSGIDFFKSFIFNIPYVRIKLPKPNITPTRSSHNPF